MNKPELLIPAGNLEKLNTAVLYGADAVYVGIAGLSLRAQSAEMTLADLAEGIQKAHAKNVKVYGAINTFARNSDLQKAKEIIPELATINIDALIVSDPGMLRLIRSLAPQLPIHLSTQANTTNAEAVRFCMEQCVCPIQGAVICQATSIGAAPTRAIVVNPAVGNTCCMNPPDLTNH